MIPNIILLSEYPVPQHHPTSAHMRLCLPYWAKAQLGAGLVLNRRGNPTSLVSVHGFQ